MTLHVLELNDAGIRVSDETGVLLASPGYALITQSQIEFGEKARAGSRVNPLNCFNQYWHRLNLDGFTRPVAHYRHNADIAFSQLAAVAKDTGLDGDVLLAVPGSFSRQQLSILLGLIKQCPFKVVGLVDAALMGAIDQTRSESVIHADLQLHQVVLSKLRRQDGELVRESVVQVPATGWVNVADSLMQLITTAFIQQCRFNPQHNAESEQILLDGLPGWLHTDATRSVTARADLNDDIDDDSQRSLLISILHNGSLHQARVSRSSLHARLQPFYQKIQQQLTSLGPDGGSKLLISDRLQLLPGFSDAFVAEVAGVSTLAEDAVTNACLRYQKEIRSAPDAMQFVTRLRPHGAAAAETAAAVMVEPDHVLCRHIARKLVDGMLIQRCGPKSVTPGALDICSPGEQSSTGEAEVLGEFAREAGHYNLRIIGSGLQLNGTAAPNRQRIQLGDRLGLTGGSDYIELIRVQERNE